MSSCLYFGKTNKEVIYPAAAIGVSHDVQTNTQRFFGGVEKDKNAAKYLDNFPVHQDDISCIGIAGGELRNIVVTGEVGKMSTVHVWDSVTMKSIAQFSLGDKAMGVKAVGISPCQRYVAAVDASNDHHMFIFNVQKKEQQLKVASGADVVYNIQWSKKPNDLRFAALSTRNIQFWHPADASKRLIKKGTFGQKFESTVFNALAFDEDGVCYSAGQNGGIYVWDQKTDLGLVLKAHAGDVTGIACNQGTLVSSGKDD